MTKSQQTYSTDLNDSEWKVMEQYLPEPTPKGPGGRPREHTRPQILNGIFYIVRSSCAWRLPPVNLPSWKTVYHYFRLWRKDSTWQKPTTPCAKKCGKEAARSASPARRFWTANRSKAPKAGKRAGMMPARK